MLVFDRVLEWMDVLEVQSVKYISEVRTPEDKYRVGASAHIIEKSLEYDAEIMESLENEKMTYRTKGKYSSTNTFILKPVEERTKLTFVGDFEPWAIPWDELSQRAAEKAIEGALEKLKNILEK